MRDERTEATPISAVPAARDTDLVTTDLGDELLVYDLRRHRAHSLNRTSALVWQQCDGKSTVPQMATRLQAVFRLETPVDEEIIWLALRQLSRAKLLQEPMALPQNKAFTRRDLAKVGIGVVGGGIILPAIVSIISPVGAVQSCIQNGNNCNQSNSNCCPGLTCKPATGGSFKCQP